MKNKITDLCLAIAISLFFVCASFAESPTLNYLIWQIPATNASGVIFPAYVYSNNAQVGYIPSSTTQVFVGEYQSGVTNASYTLYYQGKSNWHSCAIALLNGNIDQSTTTCPGAALNSPAKAGSNIWTLAVGANKGNGWPAAKTDPINPTPTDYSNRMITFVNNTEYAAIQIGEGYCDAWPASGVCKTKDQHAIVNFQQIQQEQSYTLNTDESGLSFATFYVTGYCTSDLADCYTSPGVKNKSNWILTGGYGVGGNPYATKIEVTMMPVEDGIPEGASNVDISAVDGYNFGAILYPALPAYCTYTLPPENSNISEADYYSKQKTLADLVPTDGIASLESLCKNSSQLPANHTGTPWNLVKLDSNKNFIGCLSPCVYATANKLSNQDIAKFCCTGKYDEPELCDVASGQVGANTSTYAENIGLPVFKNVYSFVFSASLNDFSCPAETNFVVSFVTGSATPTNPLSIADIAASNVTATSATLNWTVADTDPKAGTISYNIVTSPTVTIAPTVSGTTASFSGLNVDATYTVAITATDQDGNKATSTPYQFITTAYTVTAPIVTVPAATITANSAVINWTASNDVPANPNQVITYSVTATPSVGAPTITGTTTTLTGLAASTACSVFVNASDEDDNTIASAPVSFTTQAAPPPCKPFTLNADPYSGSVVYWTPIAGETAADFVSAIATPVVSGGAAVYGRQIWLLPRINSVQIKFSELVSGQTYNVVVMIKINGELYKGTTRITSN